jgi:two-component system nitrogen regulation sensor histidine kinase GlnL
VTGKLGGKGLGLALAAKIVAEHDGVIEFESQPRRTVFSVSLPLADSGFHDIELQGRANS